VIPGAPLPRPRRERLPPVQPNHCVNHVSPEAMRNNDSNARSMSDRWTAGQHECPTIRASKRPAIPCSSPDSRGLPS
jgi:hypothetical protein